jgi:2-polyprenyl-6-methoxyphenol hydroxylase-like FAD-dependent oxidoreductase
MIWDAIVVGARVAGASTAMLLARAGRKVLLVDRAKFPSDTMSTLYIGPVGVSLLKKWGLADAVRATGAPAIRSVRWEAGSIVMEGAAWSPDDITETFAPRRKVLDPLIAKAAVDAGVEFRERFTFEDVLREGDAVVGIRGHADGGAKVEERAKLVIGADGMRSKVAAAVGAEVYGEKEPLTCNYYGFFDMGPRHKMDLVTRDGAGMALVPTNEGLTLITISFPIAQFPELKADAEGGLMRAIASFGPISESAVSARRDGPVMGTGDLPFFFRKANGQGWALVGDAGYMKDPCTAQGISDALWSADRLVQAILTLDQNPDALADYTAARHERGWPNCEWTARSAQLKAPGARMTALMQAIARKPENVAQFLGILAATVSPIEFFSDENTKRILA